MHRRSWDPGPRRCRCPGLCWQGEGGAVHHLGSGDSIVVPGGSTEAEEDPSKVVQPLAGGGPSFQGFFEAAVDLLHQTIHLRMVDGGLPVPDPQGRAEDCPDS